MSSSTKIVSIVDDDLDITELFDDAVCDGIDGVSVVSFNDPVIALEHFTQNKEYNAVFQRYMQEDIIDSFIEKPVTINQLCQRVRDEFQVYQIATASQLK